MQRITPLLPRRGLLFQSLVLTYYRQNAGQLGFLFFIMFLAVGRANQAGLLEYHASLIRGMLTSPSLFGLVLLAWLIYARKCARFVASILQKPEFTFLYETPQLGTPKAYARLLQVQALLFLPVLLYVICILNVGIKEHYYGPTALVITYNILLCTISAGWYLRLLRFPTSPSSHHPLLKFSAFHPTF